MNTTLLLAYIVSIVLFLGTPEPVTVLVVNTALRHGFWAGVKTAAGTSTASLVVMAASFAIIGGVFSVSETALNWLTLAGSLYLLYFAVNLIRQHGTAPTEQAATPTPKHFRDGFLVGISNPKDILFFIAFFPMFLGVYSGSLSVAMLVLVAVWLVLDTPCFP